GAAARTHKATPRRLARAAARIRRASSRPATSRTRLECRQRACRPCVDTGRSPSEPMAKIAARQTDAPILAEQHDLEVLSHLAGQDERLERRERLRRRLGDAGPLGCRAEL